MPGEHYRHIFLPAPDTQPFTRPGGGGDNPRTPPRDRARHGAFLRRKLEAAWRESEQRQAVAHVARDGVYVDFVSAPRFDLVIKSLENLGRGIRLRNVRIDGSGGAPRTKATVYVPRLQRAYFLRRIQAYVGETHRSGRPKNAKLVESVSDIRRSILESFWMDDLSLIPVRAAEWVEVWLSTEADEIIARFNALLEDCRIERGEGELKFPERTVVLVRASREQLEHLIEASDDIAELRLAKEVSSVYDQMGNLEQAEQAQALRTRTRYRPENDVVITVLDTGVNNGHALIEPVLSNADLHTANPAWGTHDHNRHGTLMAGIATYGDLLAVLGSTAPVVVSHRLESAKILPPPPDSNPRRLWGDMTAQGISRAEIRAPNRRRIVCLAVSSTDDRDRGRPSSWSAEIDKLSSGHDDVRRLIVVAAGEVFGPEEFRAYPESNLSSEVEDPGQSWNALTVGAYTQKTRIAEPGLRNYSPVAPPGGLSPFSPTSSTWAPRKWPVKPDIVMEGGNVAKGPNDSIEVPDDLQPLSTWYKPQEAQFAPFNQTSAAVAQAAWMAASVQVRYPEAWPETIRALLVHTAEWTNGLKTQFLPTTPTRVD